MKGQALDGLTVVCRSYLRVASVPNRISVIVNGKRVITADTALRVARCFGTSAKLWLNLQTDYALRTARRVSGADINAQVHPHAA